ncbi:YceI family protein [Spongiivirga citrea]|uniref:YceI family protein n=1 Tax=Spongiivirga citrea TaxID=1481457 RepID=A0A6M0CHH5_9FLAO|nr:YceI family protein [Spongiivirga citrea]NER17406.1 YceI family protein [Spongiivirga citrea]
MRTVVFILALVMYSNINAQSVPVYELDTLKSVIHWKGTYAFQFSEHNGTVHFSKGTLQTLMGNVVGGEFIINMTSIDNEDYRNGKGPVKHLRDSDFFDVSRFPEARLKITKVEYLPEENIHRMMADLTIKGITKQQQFYANLDGTKNTFNTKLKIDRTRWGITYNNKLKDHSISDAVEFDVRLVFKPAPNAMK